MKRIKIINASEKLFNGVRDAPKLNFDNNGSHLDGFLDPFLPPDKHVCEFDTTKPKISLETGSGWI